MSTKTMSTLRMSIIAVVAIFLAGCGLLGGNGGSPATSDVTLTVIGEGTASVVPDAATLTFMVSANGAVLEEVSLELDEAMDQILATTTEAGLAGSDLEVLGRQLRYQEALNRLGQPTGNYEYQLDLEFSIEVTDFSQLEMVISTTLAAGADSIVSLTYPIDEAALELAAYQAALDEATASGEALAASLDLDLGAVLVIEELPSDEAGMSMDALSGSLDGYALQPGEWTATVRLQVKYSTVPIPPPTPMPAVETGEASDAATLEAEE